MVKKAAEFARKVHEGKLRKGSMVPYIVHPFEAAVIVSGMTDDPEVISAALLHDVIEDAGISYEGGKAHLPGRQAEQSKEHCRGHAAPGRRRLAEIPGHR